MSRRGKGGKSRHQRDAGRHESRGDRRPSDRQDLKNHHSLQPQNPHPRQPQPADDGAKNLGQRAPGKVSFPSITQPKRSLNRSAGESSVAPRPQNRVYKVMFFDTIAQAKADLASLRDLASQCDQLNIVVRAEANMDDPELNSIGQLFCGAAWALIHERRRTDGWYDSPHE